MKRKIFLYSITAILLSSLLSSCSTKEEDEYVRFVRELDKLELQLFNSLSRVDTIESALYNEVKNEEQELEKKRAAIEEYANTFEGKAVGRKNLGSGNFIPNEEWKKVLNMKQELENNFKLLNDRKIEIARLRGGLLENPEVKGLWQERSRVLAKIKTTRPQVERYNNSLSGSSRNIGRIVLIIFFILGLLVFFAIISGG